MKKKPRRHKLSSCKYSFWIREYHIDGFVFRGLSEGAADFLKKAKEVIKKEDSNILFIGEQTTDKDLKSFFDLNGIWK